MEQDYIPLEKLLNASKGSVYKLTILAAKRAFQLADGEKPLVEKTDEKPLDNALKEIAERKIKIAEERNSKKK